MVKLNKTKGIKTVWFATASAAGSSILLLALGSLFGFKMQEVYTGKVEEFIEGLFMVTSALFITWAVFFLHKYFTHYKVKLLQKVKETVEKEEQKGLFILVFTAVFREGFEIVLFLTTIYFSSNPESIFSGFSLGVVSGLLVSFTLFTATLKMPVYYAFRVTSILLILFAAGLLARGVHEFAEAGAIPDLWNIHLSIVPQNDTFAGDMIKSVFGITQKMDVIQIFLYSVYVMFMSWWVFFRNRKLIIHQSKE